MPNTPLPGDVAITEEPVVSAWSFHRLKDFETCPYRIYLKSKGAPEPVIDESDMKHPLVRGRYVHTQIEEYIRGGAAETSLFSKVRDQVELVKCAYENGQAAVEERWGFDHHWGVIDFHNPSVWLRVVADAVVFDPSDEAACVEDWKTGRSFNRQVMHIQQLQLYAVAVLQRFPKIQTVNAAMRYVDEGKSLERVFKRDVLLPLVRRWEDRANALVTATVFRPKPNKGNCRWCPYGGHVGTGACPFAV